MKAHWPGDTQEGHAFRRYIQRRLIKAQELESKIMIQFPAISHASHETNN